jgi:hypothetical protein
VRASALVPGNRITWQGAEGTPRGPATIDFLHTAPDGTGWAFVTLASGWVAVNMKVVTQIEQETDMPTKQTDREASNPALPFPTPPGFGEPIAYLIVAMNAQGQPHVHLQGTMEQAFYLVMQGLNYAISGIVVESLKRSLADATLGPWPVTREGQS